MVTDYNDGQWHGWNGGECPVHPETVVDTRHLKSGPINNSEIYSWAAKVTEQAGWFDSECWAGIDDDKHNPIVAFRVVKPYREPLECWVTIHGHAAIGAAYDTEADARAMAASHRSIRVALFREVTEGGDA